MSGLPAGGVLSYFTRHPTAANLLLALMLGLLLLRLISLGNITKRCRGLNQGRHSRLELCNHSSVVL